MKIKIQLLLFLLASNFFVTSQNLFTQDTVCSIAEVNLPVFANETLARWNFNKKKFTLVNSFSNEINGDVVDLKFIKEGANWYGFLPSYKDNFSVLSFNESLESFPILTSYSNLDNNITDARAVDIIKGRNVYLGAISNFGSKPVTFIKFNNGLDKKPEVVTFNSFPILKLCTAIDFYTQGDSLIGLFTDYDPEIVYKFLFDTDFLNDPIFLEEYRNGNNDVLGQSISKTDTSLLIVNNSYSSDIHIINQDLKNKKTSAGKGFATRIYGMFNSHMYLGNGTIGVFTYDIDGKVQFVEIDNSLQNLLSVRALDIPQNTDNSFKNKMGIEVVKDGENEYLIIQSNKNTNKTFIYKIEESKTNWKQVEYTAFNSTSNSFVYKTDSIFIYPEQKANLLSNSTCSADSIILYNTTIEKNNLINNYKWKSSDFDTTTTNNLKHKFIGSGEREIKLIITDQCGRKDSSSKTINIISIEDIKSKIKSPDTLCTQSSNIFKNTSTTTFDSIISNTWTLKDTDLHTVAHSNAQNFQYVFDSTQTYYLSLKNRGQSSCISDTTITITPLNGPKASFSFSNYCLNDSLIISENSNDHSISKIEWFVNNLKSSETLNTFKTHNNSLSNKRITLNTFNILGCTSSAEKTIQITPLPLAAFDSTFFCADQEKTILNRSTIQDFTPLSYFWYKGDSLLSTSQNPNINLGSSSQDTLILIAKSTNNCTDTVSKILKIENKPTPLFTYQNTCLAQTSQFFDQSSDPKSTITNRKWTINQANFSSKNPSYVFSQHGTFPISLEVTNALGCKNNLTKNIVIDALPIPNFYIDEACQGSPTIFHGESNLPIDSISQWQWSLLGEGTLLTGKDITYTYQKNGSKLAQLTITNTNNCSNSYIGSLEINPKPTSKFTLNQYEGTPGANFVAANKSTNANQYFWVNNLNQLLSTAENPTFIFDSSSTFDLQLVAQSDANCRDTSSSKIEIFHPINHYTIKKLESYTESDQLYFVLEIENTGNTPLTTLNLEMDFGGQFIQQLNIPTSIAKNSSQLIKLPLTISSQLDKKYHYICIESKDSINTDTLKTCIFISEIFKKIGLYPSPAKDYIHVEYYLPNTQGVDIEVLNMQGVRLFYQNNAVSLLGKQSVKIDISSFRQGMYLLIIKTPTESIVQKFEKIE